VFANNFKTVTSRMLRKEFGTALAKVYKKPELWSGRYVVATCGGASLAVIKQYIERQERPE
jgi:putative transposase